MSQRVLLGQLRQINMFKLCFGILYCLTSVGKRRNSVSPNVSNLVGNIFVFQEANFVSAIKANVSRCGRQGNIRANIENHECFLRLAKALI
jgi:hypothetical protein